MTRFFPCCSLLLIALHAQTPVLAQEPASKFQPAPLFTPAMVKLQTLPNGVRGVIKQTQGTDLVSVQVWVRAGSRFETSDTAGAAHLIETLALQGSKNYPAQPNGDGGAEDAIESVGGNLTTLTARDATFYSATVASPFLPAAMRVLSDAVLNPDFSPGAIEDAKAQVNDDATVRSYDPVALASDLAYETAFSKHPYKRPAGGGEAAEGLSDAKIHEFFRKWYVGSNITVVVVGDVSPSDVQKLLARHFSSAPSAKPPLVKLATDEPPKTIKTATTRAKVLRGVLDLAWRSPGISAPDDVVATDTLLSLWRTGLDANLRRILLNGAESGAQEEGNGNGADKPQPLVASYDVDFLTQRDGGLFLVSLVDPRDSREAEKRILDEIRRLRDAGPDEAEVARARTFLMREYIDQSATVSTQAGALGFYDMIDSYGFAVSYLDRCARVKPADIQRIAKKYLSPDAYVRAEITPAPRPEAQPENDAPVITARRLETGIRREVVLR